MHAGDLPTACENCHAVLQGRFCHVCGQNAANPLRHFGHALEDVFESFWHLDGRVFRTLRELALPGRVACNYLAGHRVRYIPPLRLFVILVVITFFFGQLAVSVGADGKPARDARTGLVRVQADGAARAGRSIQSANTEAGVQAALERQLAELAEARRGTAFVPAAGVALDQAEKDVRALAARRIAQLRAGSGTTPAAAPAADAKAAPARAAEAPEDEAAETRRGLQQMARRLGTLRDPKADWHERDNPVDVAALPPFADRWLNHRLANTEHNVERIQREGESLMLKLALAAVPSALFVLVPLFALLLKLLYVFTPRGALEHLVVALYSHATMLLVLLATFVFILLRAAAGPGMLSATTSVLQVGLWIALPVYLLLMQKRVYGQGWPMTLLKYLTLGSAYLVLVVMMVLYTVFAALTGGA